MKVIDLIDSSVIDSSLKIGYLGQSGYILKKNDFTMLIDPYLSNFIDHSEGLNDIRMKRNFPPPIYPDELKNVDVVLCTHAHHDHMDPWTLEKIDSNYILYCSEVAYKKNPTNIPSSRLKFIDCSKPVYFNEFELISIPAAHYHTHDENGDPDCLSFLIKVGNLKLFFWGDGILYDTLIENLSSHHFDIFFAPINGRDWFREKEGIIGNINSIELAKICSKLKIDTVVPNHFDLFHYNSEIPSHFISYLKKFTPNQKFLILEQGSVIKK